MARTKDKLKAIALRKEGMSYSEIKNRLGISKSTLSGWLYDMPLSQKRVNQLRANSEIRIERYRTTMQNKKESRRDAVYIKVSNDLLRSKDVTFVAGFYLYWGEGTKSAECTTALTNSDPSIVRCFVSWLESLGVPRSKMKIKLHAYTDQDELQLKKFWSKTLKVPLHNFNKTYIKETSLLSKTYKGMFPYGTCVVMYHNRDMYEYVMGGIRYLRDTHSR